MTIDMVIELIERRYNRCVYKHGKLKESIEAESKSILCNIDTLMRDVQEMANQEMLMSEINEILDIIKAYREIKEV